MLELWRKHNSFKTFSTTVWIFEEQIEFLSSLFEWKYYSFGKQLAFALYMYVWTRKIYLSILLFIYINITFFTEKKSILHKEAGRMWGWQVCPPQYCRNPCLLFYSFNWVIGYPPLTNKKREQSSFNSIVSSAPAIVSSAFKCAQ